MVIFQIFEVPSLCIAQLDAVGVQSGKAEPEVVVAPKSAKLPAILIPPEPKTFPAAR